MNPKKTSDYNSCLVVTLLPKDTNAHGHIFGGVVMSLMDQAAAVVAMRYSGSRVVTASADEITFCTPILVGEVLTARATIVYTGKTSIDIEVKVQAENILQGNTRLAVKGYFTMVALNEQGKPTAITPMAIETESEKQRHLEAERRRVHKGLLKK